MCLLTYAQAKNSRMPSRKTNAFRDVQQLRSTTKHPWICLDICAITRPTLRFRVFWSSCWKPREGFANKSIPILNCSSSLTVTVEFGTGTLLTGLSRLKTFRLNRGSIDTQLTFLQKLESIETNIKTSNITNQAATLTYQLW